MGETVRFGVSLDSDLLEKFDALCERQGCPSRSEALRDIIRDALVQDSLHSETADAAGVLSLIYDHHVRDLSRKLTERQHDAHGLIVTTLHVHLDHHNCLEILVLKGKAGELRELADQLRSIRGVTHGTFSIKMCIRDRRSRGAMDRATSPMCVSLPSSRSNMPVADAVRFGVSRRMT